MKGFRLGPGESVRLQLPAELFKVMEEAAAAGRSVTTEDAKPKKIGWRRYGQECKILIDGDAVATIRMEYSVSWKSWLRSLFGNLIERKRPQ